ncbi:hypothetical protein PPERSA_10767 [Pseudocohnilembus persalinus]|uniref:Uncharacterized protein n=1 Tax=Pseudocohnilembus persalinus TaxID=266149 RepID=A0A0V0QDI3_PSEPJ|nr:hypothetical protein PPERSA_10767 [Pseudocohnilembus persalinus]|eukprot:KRX00268.1 hypothetical protein PPERSA_10767 [Pseudocohnilembus persalinus]
MGYSVTKTDQQVSQILIFICCTISLFATTIVLYKMIYQRNIKRVSYSQKIIAIICLLDAIWSMNIIWSQIFVWLNQQQQSEFYKRGIFTNSYTDYVIYQDDKIDQQKYLKNCYLTFLKTKESGIDTLICPNQGIQKYSCIIGTILRWLLVIIPTPLLIIYIKIVYQKINDKLKQSVGSINKTFIGESDKKQLQKFMYIYPGILFVSWFLIYILRLFETLNLSVGGELSLYIIFTIGYMMVSLMGLANSLHFTINSQNQNKRQLSQISWFKDDEGKIDISSFITEQLESTITCHNQE